MPRAQSAIPRPVPLRAERRQAVYRRGSLRMATKQADRGETEPLASGGQRMQVIGMCPAEADDAFGTALVSGLEVFDEFEPFVATDQRVDQVQAQDGDIDVGAGEPVEVKGFEGSLG